MAQPRQGLMVGVRRGLVAAVMDGTKVRFELTPEVEFLAVGTLAKEFETSVKAPRFTDRRG